MCQLYLYLRKCFQIASKGLLLSVFVISTYVCKIGGDPLRFNFVCFVVVKAIKFKLNYLFLATFAKWLTHSAQTHIRPYNLMTGIADKNGLEWRPFRSILWSHPESMLWWKWTNILVSDYTHTHSQKSVLADSPPYPTNRITIIAAQFVGVIT